MNMTAEADIYCQVAGSLYLVMSLCGVLNIPVLYCHLQRSKSFETILFALTAIINLITCGLGIIEAAMTFDVYFTKSNEMNVRLFYKNLGNVANDTILALTGALALVSSTFLIIMRTIKIIRPFHHGGKRRYLIAVVILNIYFIACSSLIIYWADVDTSTLVGFIKFLEEFGPRFRIMIQMVFAVSALLTVVGSTLCLVTMGYLHKYSKIRRKSIRGGRTRGLKERKKQRDANALITLFLMNLPFIVHLVISIVYVIKLFEEDTWIPKFEILRSLYFLGVPIIVAVCNPAILLARNRNYRQKLRSCLSKSESKVSTTITTTTNSSDMVAFPK